MAYEEKKGKKSVDVEKFGDELLRNHAKEGKEGSKPGKMFDTELQSLEKTVAEITSVIEDLENRIEEKDIKEFVDSVTNNEETEEDSEVSDPSEDVEESDSNILEFDNEDDAAPEADSMLDVAARKFKDIILTLVDNDQFSPRELNSKTRLPMPLCIVSVKGLLDSLKGKNMLTPEGLQLASQPVTPDTVIQRKHLTPEGVQYVKDQWKMLYNAGISKSETTEFEEEGEDNMDEEELVIGGGLTEEDPDNEPVEMSDEEMEDDEVMDEDDDVVEISLDVTEDDDDKELAIKGDKDMDADDVDKEITLDGGDSEELNVSSGDKAVAVITIDVPEDALGGDSPEDVAATNDDVPGEDGNLQIEPAGEEDPDIVKAKPEAKPEEPAMEDEPEEKPEEQTELEDEEDETMDEDVDVQNFFEAALQELDQMIKVEMGKSEEVDDHVADFYKEPGVFKEKNEVPDVKNEPIKKAKKEKKEDVEAEEELLPVAENAKWDCIGSIKRLQKAAVRSDTSIDYDMLRKTHLYVDESNSKSLDAYLYPIADIVDGKAMVIPGAIKKMSEFFSNDTSLMNLQLDEAVISHVRGTLERYLKKLGEEEVPWKAVDDDSSSSIHIEEQGRLIKIYHSLNEYDAFAAVNRYINRKNNQ